eukprot:scaffold32220_cov25-Prasinocladus_malaysianus.AAC.2
MSEKTDNYRPLVSLLRKYWGAVHLVCLPVGQVSPPSADSPKGKRRTKTGELFSNSDRRAPPYYI